MVCRSLLPPHCLTSARQKHREEFFLFTTQVFLLDCRTSVSSETRAAIWLDSGPCSAHERAFLKSGGLDVGGAWTLDAQGGSLDRGV